MLARGSQPATLFFSKYTFQTTTSNSLSRVVLLISRLHLLPPITSVSPFAYSVPTQLLNTNAPYAMGLGVYILRLPWPLQQTNFLRLTFSSTPRQRASSAVFGKSRSKLANHASKTLEVGGHPNYCWALIAPDTRLTRLCINDNILQHWECPAD